MSAKVPWIIEGWSEVNFKDCDCKFPSMMKAPHWKIDQDVHQVLHTINPCLACEIILTRPQIGNKASLAIGRLNSIQLTPRTYLRLCVFSRASTKCAGAMNSWQLPSSLFYDAQCRASARGRVPYHFCAVHLLKLCRPEVQQLPHLSDAVAQFLSSYGSLPSATGDFGTLLS